MFGDSSFDFFQEDVKEETERRPPCTFNEWLIYNNLEDWPIEPEYNDENAELTIDSAGLGTKEEILEELKKKAPFQISTFDVILNEVNSLEEKVKEYASFFFDKRATKDDVPRGNERKPPASVKQDHVKLSTSKVDKLFNANLKSIENAVFPGFFPNELAPLPGAVEAPQLLNYITTLQDFSGTYTKLWKRFFSSEASVAILQDFIQPRSQSLLAISILLAVSSKLKKATGPGNEDAFWWIFLQTTHKDTECLARSQLFNRLAKSFVSLFLSISYEDKDKFFQYYPNCLSQAIYSAFCAGFPGSTQKFDENFRAKLLSLIYEWVAGTCPHVQELIRWWDLEALESKICPDDSDERNQLLKSRLSFDEENFLRTTPRNTEEGIDLFLTSPKDISTVVKSHPAGRGPRFQKIAFNIYGRSPFIMHYLASKDLQRENEVPRKIVTRTQVSDQETQGQHTYDELVRNHRIESKERKDGYEKMISQITKDCRIVQKHKRKDLRTMAKVQDELMMKHFDIKILSQNIVDQMTRSDFSTRHLTSPATDGKSDDVEK